MNEPADSPFTSGPRSNKDLIEALEHMGVLESPAISGAMKELDRVEFAGDQIVGNPYQFIPITLSDNSTISSPETVARMLELLDVQKGQIVLEVGSGSGWVCALLSKIVGPGGSVTGVDIVPDMVSLARRNLSRYEWAGNINILHTSEFKAGHNVYDRIIVSASCKAIPQELTDALKPGGKIIVPVKGVSDSGDNAVYSDTLVLAVKQPDGSVIVDKQYGGYLFVEYKQGNV